MEDVGHHQEGRGLRLASRRGVRLGAGLFRLISLDRAGLRTLDRLRVPRLQLVWVLVALLPSTAAVAAACPTACRQTRFRGTRRHLFRLRSGFRHLKAALRETTTWVLAALGQG